MGKTAERKQTETSALAKGPVPIIAVTMGDAAGVGPELCLRLLNEPSWPEGSIPLVFGDVRILERVAKAIDMPLKVPRLKEIPDPLVGPAVLDIPDALAGLDIAPGRNQGPCGKAALHELEDVAGTADRRVGLAPVLAFGQVADIHAMQSPLQDRGG